MPNCMFPVPIKLSEKAYVKRFINWQLSDMKREMPSHYVYVRCGKCESCLKQKRNEWLLRLCYHLKFQDQPSYFVTLTYNDESLKYSDHGVASVSPTDITLFFKRLRHTASVSFSYFLVSEYGEKSQRPHYHLILFNYSADPAKIEDAWQQGNIFVGDVTDASINYCAKYFITKQQSPDGAVDNFARISKGIGRDLRDVKGMRQFVQNNGIIYNGNIKVTAPRYYKDFWQIDSFRLPYHEIGKLPEFDTKEKYDTYVNTHTRRKNRLLTRKTNMV